MQKEIIKFLGQYGFKKVAAIPLGAFYVRRRFGELKQGLRDYIVVKGGKVIPVRGTGYRAKPLGMHKGEYYFIVWREKPSKGKYMEAQSGKLF